MIILCVFISTDLQTPTKQAVVLSTTITMKGNAVSLRLPSIWHTKILGTSTVFKMELSRSCINNGKTGLFMHVHIVRLVQPLIQALYVLHPPPPPPPPPHPRPVPPFSLQNNPTAILSIPLYQHDQHDQ